MVQTNLNLMSLENPRRRPKESNEAKEAARRARAVLRWQRSKEGRLDAVRRDVPLGSRQWRACGSKHRFASQAQAEAAIRFNFITPPNCLHAYQCGYCGGWHIALNNTGKFSCYEVFRMYGKSA